MKLIKLTSHCANLRDPNNHTYETGLRPGSFLRVIELGSLTLAKPRIVRAITEESSFNQLADYSRTEAVTTRLLTPTKHMPSCERVVSVQPVLGYRGARATWLYITAEDC